jgi:cytoskeletal protein RodZ
MSAPVPTLDSPDADFGGRMRRARESRGVSLRQIADSTKLSMAVLASLERNDVSRLPGGLFSRAFIRSYASEIGMDPEATVRDFLMQFPDDTVPAAGSRTRTMFEDSATGSRRKTGVILVVSVVALVLAAALLYYFYFLPRR